MSWSNLGATSIVPGASTLGLYESILLGFNPKKHHDFKLIYNNINKFILKYSVNFLIHI